LKVIKRRLPTRREILLLLMVCVLPIHFRSILIFLHGLPSFLLSTSVWDTVGVFSYVQAFSLLESVVIIAAFLFICISLPSKIFRDKFVAQGTVLIVLTTLWVVPLHYQASILSGLNWNIRAYQVIAAIWVITYLVGIVLSFLMIRTNQKTEYLINRSVERILPLSSFYLLLDAVCIMVLVYRLVS